MNLNAIKNRGMNMASNLGLANEYNVFVLRDQTQSNTNFEGKVAVAGRINYAYNNVATALPISTTSFDVIVGKEKIGRAHV